MTIAAARAAMADALDGITGLMSAGWMTDNVNPPCAVVMLDAVDYDLVLGGSKQEWTYTVDVYAGRVAEVESQKRLDEYREPSGSTSVKAALQADAVATAAGVDYINVRSVGQVGVATVGGVDYLTVRFTVEVAG